MGKKYQVFIASTYTDLIKERQAAVEAILKAGHIPAGMELFAAGNESQLDTITRWIDDSDIYMLILGSRYGQIEPKTGLSYTEIEYDYAVKSGKPFFAVVITESAIDNKVAIVGKQCLELKNASKLASFRDKVLSKISTFFDDHKDIKLAVFESISDLEKRFKIEGWLRANEIQDTTPLLKEIERLSKSLKSEQTKNNKLQKEVDKLTSINSEEKEFDKIIEILSSKKVKSSEIFFIKAKEEFKISLLALLNIFRDSLSIGVTNSYGMGNEDNYIFFTFAPKLHTYGLVDNEKVAGASYRRYYLTKKGHNFLKHCDINNVFMKKSDSAEQKN